MDYQTEYSKPNKDRRPRGYWTLERCKADALKYKTKPDWKNNSASAHQMSYRRGWVGECCAHMVRPKHHNDTWSLDACKADALKYKTKNEWRKNSGGAASRAYREGWQDECCSHMQEVKKPTGYWNLSRCREDALKYKTKTQWSKANHSAYAKASNNNWLEACCGHMVSKRKPNGYWTLERCKIDALNYKSKSEWESGSSSAYGKSMVNGWLDECCSHMEQKQKPNGYWTFERCLEIALRYNRAVDWVNGHKTSYHAATRSDFYDKCIEHMDRRRVLTYENVKADAARYKSRTEWRDGGGWAYSKACVMGWLDECCSHMEQKQKQNGYWTLERCIEISAGFKNKQEWKDESSGSLSIAYRNGWMDKCDAHMEDRNRTDDDALYIWRSPNEYFNGKPVYKIGITSQRLGKARILQVNKEAEIIVLANIDDGNASDHERILLMLGDDPKFIDRDGKTEYRALSDDELKEALEYIESI